MKKGLIIGIVVLLGLGGLYYPGVREAYEKHLLNESLINLRNLSPALFDENTGQLCRKIDMDRVRKLPRYTGDINGIPNLMICPISGKPYVYKPYASKRGVGVNFEYERRIVLYSPWPNRLGMRAVLEGDEGTVFTLSEEQFRIAAANNFIVQLH